jgi:hypothetical protein
LILADADVFMYARRRRASSRGAQRWNPAPVARREVDPAADAFDLRAKGNNGVVERSAIRHPAYPASPPRSSAFRSQWPRFAAAS